jgi:hypothetical protein
MMTSAECRARAAVATLKATSIADEATRSHFEGVAADWARLAVTALAQEVCEAELVGRTGPLA